jgi:hypothetical protein
MKATGSLMFTVEARRQIRRPNPEGRKKAEFRRPNRLPVGLEPRQFQKQKLNRYTILGHRSPGAAWERALSGFGFRPSFGLRPSGFGLPLSGFGLPPS